MVHAELSRDCVAIDERGSSAGDDSKEEIVVNQIRANGSGVGIDAVSVREHFIVLRNAGPDISQEDPVIRVPKRLAVLQEFDRPIDIDAAVAALRCRQVREYSE